ncbi:ATP-dependent RNA helicase HrpA [Nesterenkonia halophila]
MTDSAAAVHQFTAETLNYPEILPVTGERETILEALRSHQVVVVAGETGSGKTTQLPKMLLELGSHGEGIVGHTQPRRLAARTVAERLAEEIGTPLGRDVGYQVRFTSEVSSDTAVKLMTDGILLAEIQRDPMLRKYSAIIIDEAHERSLTIDVILGYLKSILPRRPDLKVVVTSATIDPERFAAHFSENPEEPTVPIVEVSGRTYPVEVRYRPLRPDEDDPAEDAAGAAGGEGEDAADDHADSGRERDLMEAVGDAVRELAAEPDGDMLIFFPGEREIRDAADALADVVAADRRLAGSEILPLFGRLSMAEQKRVFSPGGRRRIVLATNVAETSLTVPGIKYVIDTGTARISRYSTRTKVQRLPIEPISQASANQRAGRCGRTSDGVAIRLYSQADFESRPEFTDPEILRTSLASVLLQMSSMGITQTPDELLDFPFVQPPDSKAVTDAVRLLTELGALHAGGGASKGVSEGASEGASKSAPKKGTITRIGRTLADLPVDPRLGRMMVEAARRDCLAEVTVLVAALSVQDPRERPFEQRQQADAMHARFADDDSDFSALLNLWRHLVEQQHELSGNQFRKMCRREHLNYLRVREWQDLVGQLLDIARRAELTADDAGSGGQRNGRGGGRKPRGGRQDGAGAALPRARELTVDPVARHEPVHRALLVGLLSQIGLRDPRTRDYQGARGTRFAIFPGSALFKKGHDLVMAAELVETSRLWARMVARIDPSWVEEAGEQLIKTTYGEPHWSAAKGAVVAAQRKTLFGVPVVADRTVLYGRVDPELSRRVFIQRALVEGDWRTRHHFDARNRRRVEEIEELQNRTRRKDLLASDEEIAAFFDARVPEHVVSQRHFDAWWKKQRHETPELLDLAEEQLLAESAEDLDVEAFPETLDVDGLRLELQYEFDPTGSSSSSTSSGGTPTGTADGVTVRVPVVFLNQLRREALDWLIPGLRTELITQLIRSMPKQVRKNFVPAPDVAATARERLEAEHAVGAEPLPEALAAVLQDLRGIPVESSVFDLDALPEHLRLTVAVVSDKGRVLDSSQNLEELQLRFAEQTREAITRSLAGSGPSAGDAAPDPGGTGRSHPTGQHGRAGAQHTAQEPVSGAAAPDGGRPATGAGAAVPTQREQTAWTFGDLPRRISTVVSGHEVSGYPALHPEPEGRGGVFCSVQDSAEDQTRIHRRGVVALLREVLPSPQRYVVEHLSTRERLAFGQAPHGTVDSLVVDCTTAALDHLLGEEPPFTAAEFEQVSRHARAELIEQVLGLTDVVAQVLSLRAEVDSRLQAASSPALREAVSDMQAQLAQLVPAGFVSSAGAAQVRHLPRYLRAMLMRLDRLEAGQSLSKDATDRAMVQQLEDEYDAAVEAVPAQRPVPASLRAVSWMLEELRVNLFAQQLGTAQPVSSKRIRRALKQASR